MEPRVSKCLSYSISASDSSRVVIVAFPVALCPGTVVRIFPMAPYPP